MIIRHRPPGSNQANTGRGTASSRQQESLVYQKYYMVFSWVTQASRLPHGMRRRAQRSPSR
jgi:hypothetical protein